MEHLKNGGYTLMELRKTLCERNRRIVQDGLSRRQAARHDAQVEADLEAFENDMLQRLNDNYAESVWEDLCNSLFNQTRQECEDRINKRAESRASRAERKERAKDSAIGCLVFFAFVMVMSWLTTWTSLEVWKMVVLDIIAGGALFFYLLNVNIMCREEAE